MCQLTEKNGYVNDLNQFKFVDTHVSCRITFPETSSLSKKRKHDEEQPKEVNQEVLVEPFVVPNRGPYPFNQPKK